MRQSENVDQALIQLSKAKEMNMKIGDQLTEAFILEHFGYCYGDSGNYEEAMKMALDAIEIYKQQSHELGKANNLMFYDLPMAIWEKYTMKWESTKKHWT